MVNRTTDTIEDTNCECDPCRICTNKNFVFPALLILNCMCMCTCKRIIHNDWFAAIANRLTFFTHLFTTQTKVFAKVNSFSRKCNIFNGRPRFMKNAHAQPIFRSKSTLPTKFEAHDAHARGHVAWAVGSPRLWAAHSPLSPTCLQAIG